MKSISIVIPTLNEEHYIGRLLTSIVRQTIQPTEVIIVDAQSTDTTSEVASTFSKKLPLKMLCAPKGIARQRNIGAKASNGNMLLFLDADVELDPDFIEKALPEFEARGLHIASSHFYVDKNCTPLDRAGTWMISKYHGLFQYGKNPMGSGFCLLTSRQLHNNIQGFNEEFQHSEDHDYVKRAVHTGATYRILRTPKFKISNRRHDKDGRLNVMSLYAKAELNRMFFDYKYAPREQPLYGFGEFNKQAQQKDEAITPSE